MIKFRKYILIFGNKNLNYFREKQAKTIHCSNVPIGFQNWPCDTALGFGNSPPDTPLGKVVGGKLKFQDILEKQEDKNVLVENLMEMLNCRDKYSL